MIASLFSAFVLGLLSSFHCVGMCGPLALALPMQGMGVGGRVVAGLSYHGGRVLVYTLAGVLFGAFGRGVWLAGWQQEFSILLGVVVLMFALPDRFRPGGFSFFAPLQGMIVRLWKTPGRGKFMLLGMANGLLPCGMVYLAIAGALTRDSVLGSAGFMACFGIGTLPMLLALQWAGYRLGFSGRARLRRVVPVISIVIGVLLILRGLNLGVPFISPVLAGAPGRVVSCQGGRR